MEGLWYGFVLAHARGMAAWFGLAMRIPRCQYCRVPAIAWHTNSLAPHRQSLRLCSGAHAAGNFSASALSMFYVIEELDTALQRSYP